jgi:hypothetical protein
MKASSPVEVFCAIESSMSPPVRAIPLLPGQGGLPFTVFGTRLKETCSSLNVEELIEAYGFGMKPVVSKGPGKGHDSILLCDS